MDLAIGVIIGGAFGKIVDTEPPVNSEPFAPITPEDVLLLSEIRDSLKNQSTLK
jgi:large-conductance mechanosensitive channel